MTVWLPNKPLVACLVVPVPSQIQQRVSVVEQTAPIFMTASEVARALRIGRRTLDDLVAAGACPPPIRLSRKTVRWPRAAIEALASRGAA